MISENLDAQYMQAVKSGDMETAQRMVDEAANIALKNSAIRDDSFWNIVQKKITRNWFRVCGIPVPLEETKFEYLKKTHPLNKVKV